MDSTCVEYENGSALHIAATNLSFEAVRVLLGFGADPDLKDDLARKPVDCVPEAEDYSLIPDSGDLVEKVTELLSRGLTSSGEVGGGRKSLEVGVARKGPGGAAGNLALNKMVSGKTVLKALGLDVSIWNRLAVCLLDFEVSSS